MCYWPVLRRIRYDCKQICQDIRFTSHSNQSTLIQYCKWSTDVKLPMLSKWHKFETSLQIVPQQDIMNHGVILGLETMKQIDLDTSVCNSSISWSNKLVTPMVSHTFWTNKSLQKMVESLNTTHADPVQESPTQKKCSHWTHNGSSIRPPSHIFRTWQSKSQSGGYQRRLSWAASQPGCICHQISVQMIMTSQILRM